MMVESRLCRTIGRAALAVLACLGACYGQTPAFDAASVKPSPAPAAGRAAPALVRGGPGSADPGLARFDNIDLFSLVTMAYGIGRYQLSGPEWLSAARFDINARVPEGTTRDQYRLMLQNLLAERFKLALHHETREIQVYELTVGKNGPKMKVSPVDPDAPDPGLQPPPTSSPPRGYNGPVSISAKKQSMEWLAGVLSGQLGQPVLDVTGLKGNYDITLHWSGLQAPAISESAEGAAASSEPTLFEAVQEQLGLKLTPKKVPFDVLVIDHVERDPTTN